MPSRTIPIDAIRQPAWVYGPDGRVRAANDLAEALAGRSLAGRSIAEVGRIFAYRHADGTPFTPDELPASRAIKGEEVVDLAVTVALADGSEREIVAAASPIREGDAITGALVLWQDGTGRKRAEVAEERLQALMDHTPCLVFLKDEQGRYVYLNETYERQFVHSTEWCGKTDYDFWPAESADLFRANDREVLESGRTVQYLEDSTGLDGTRYCWLNYKFPFTDAQGERYVGGIGIDATALVRAEEALAESEEEYRHLVEYAPTGIYEIDYAGPRFRRVNDAMCRILGYTREELMAMDPGSFLDDESRARFRERAQRMIAGEGIDEKVVYRLFARDGREIWAELNAKPTFTDGRMDGALVVAHDITERKRAEAALTESQERQAFLLGLGDRLRGLSSAHEITAVAAEMVGRHLDANGVVFCEIDGAGDCATVRADWTDGTVPPAAGRFRMDDFGIGDLYRRGGVRRTSDVTGSLDEDAAGEHCALRIRASLGVPVMRGGTLSAVLAVHSSRTRHWTDAEVELVREAGARIWSELERAKADEALRESEAKYRTLFETMDEGFLLGELVRDSQGRAVDYRVLEVNPAFEVHTGVGRDAVSRLRSDTTPARDERMLAAITRAVETGQPVRVEQYNRRLGRWLSVGLFPYGGDQFAQLFDDITEQKRAGAALRESEERFRTVVENSRDGINLLDLRTGRYVLMSPSQVEMTGYSLDEINTISAGEACDPVHPDDRAIPVEQQRLIASGEEPSSTVEYRWRMKTGEYRWFSDSRRLVRDADGTPVAMVGVSRDITVQKEAEASLREAERHLARAQEIARVGSWAWDIPNDRLTWSDEAYRIFGLEPGEIPTPGNQDFLAFVHPDDRERVATAVQNALASGSYNIEFRFVRKGGDEGYAHSQAAVTFADGSPVMMEGTVQDLTERRQADEALRETRDYLDSLIDHANAPIIVWDPAFRITRFNAAFEHLSGHAADEVLGRDLAVLFPEESREESLAEIARTITEQWESVEIPILRPDGRVRIALWNSANIYTTDGTALLATIAQGQDITERKEAEEALREYAESLRRSNEDLQRFAYVASHDLQEPLRSVVSFSQLLERRYRGQLGEDADEYIDFIVEGGQRMQGLILDLLAFSRVNTTRQQIARTDAEDVLAEAVRTLDVSLREADATLTHDPLPVVMADPTQLAQVFSNLVSNAVKFRRPDVPLRIHVGAKRLDGFWEFSVRDNGIGIEEEYFEKIFVIFQRLHTKDAYPGTGIGLAIVKRIIDRHGGRIRVESVPGEGSTFFFTLPVA